MAVRTVPSRSGWTATWSFSWRRWPFFPIPGDPGFMLGALGCPKQPADDRLVATAAAQLSDTCHRTQMAEAYLVVCLKHAPLHQAELTEWRYEMPAATT